MTTVGSRKFGCNNEVVRLTTEGGRMPGSTVHKLKINVWISQCVKYDITLLICRSILSKTKASLEIIYKNH